VAISQYILGIQPDYQGLIINPCIPRSWDEYKVRRYYRGAFYNIRIQNPQKVSQGVQSITADGKRLTSQVLPIYNDGREHEVEVILG
jgi:cellobiose phosphorylase